MVYSLSPRLRGVPCDVKIEVMKTTDTKVRQMLSGLFEKVHMVGKFKEIKAADARLINVHIARINSKRRCTSNVCTFTATARLQMSLYKNAKKHIDEEIAEPGEVEARIRNCEDVRAAYKQATENAVENSLEMIRERLVQVYGPK